MRTNIDIDRLMRQAMQRSRARTKKAVVEAGLKLLVAPMPKVLFAVFVAKCYGKAI